MEMAVPHDIQILNLVPSTYCIGPPLLTVLALHVIKVPVSRG